LEALTDATVFNRAPDERRRLFVRVWVFKEPPGKDENGTNRPETVLGSRAAAKLVVARTVADANSLLSQAGIQVELARSLDDMFVEAPKRDGKNVLDESPPRVIDLLDAVAIAQAFRGEASTDVLDVFFAGHFAKGIVTDDEGNKRDALGLTMTPSQWGDQLGDVSFSFVDTGDGLKYELVLAHELCHTLENWGRDESNPPGYVFYPTAGAYGQTNGTWSSARRLTHFTEYLIRETRPLGVFSGAGSHYLKDW
jgi:hypothetical protein